MRYARIALLSAAAACLLPFATPAIAQVGFTELGHPTGCANCGPVTIHPWGTQGRPVVEPELRIGFPPGAVALVPAVPPVAGGCQVQTWNVPGSYNPGRVATCP
jgi:hypothetical protein